jgi:hypothetical protein
MAESKSRSSNMTQSVEKFEFKWSNTGQPSKVNQAPLPSNDSGAFSYEAVIEAPSAPEISIPETPEVAIGSETINDDTYPPMDSYPPPSVDVYPTVDATSFRASPKTGRKLSLPSVSFPSIPRGMRLRLLAIGGWSGMAGVGAGVLVSTAGSLPLTKLGILGLVWCGVTVSVWVLIGKLAK